MTGWMIGAVAIFAALAFAIWLHQREKRRLARMLDDAPSDADYQWEVMP